MFAPEILVSIPAGAFILLFLSYQIRNKSTFGPISFMLAIYVLLGFSGVASYLGGFNGNQIALNIVPTAYLTLCLLFALLGFVSFRDRTLRFIEIENILLVRALEGALILLSTVAFFFFLPSALSALLGDIDETRKNIARHVAPLAEWGYLNSTLSLVANSFPISIVLGFVNLSTNATRPTFSRSRAVLLFLSSGVFVVYVLAYAGRDGAVLWGMTFIFIYLLMRDFISPKDRKRITRSLVVFSLALLVPFLLITYYRFVDHPLGLLGGIQLYIGDQLFTFNDIFLSFTVPQQGKLNFPVLYRLFDPGFIHYDRSLLIEMYLDEGVKPWRFATFVGAFLFDFGYVITALLVLLIAAFARGVLRAVARDGRLSLSRLLIFVLLAQIVLYGVFYFRHASMNVYMLFVVALALVFRLGVSRKLRRTIGKLPRANPKRTRLFIFLRHSAAPA